MGTILKGGTVIEFEPATAEVVDLRIDAGHIVERGAQLSAQPGDEVIDVGHKLVMPGLVCAHHHLYSSLSRGMPPPAKAPASFPEILERVWWRLDQALDLDAVQVSATVGALDALACGTTTVFDHHASPRAISGSLLKVARGVNDVGLRAVLCYETSDRHGAVGREEGIEESVSFQRKARGRFRGMVGAHACFTLSRDALDGLREATAATGTGLHIHLAEDPSDERLSFERYGETPVLRLQQAGLLGPQTLIAHAVHLSWPELSEVIGTGAWLVHNPRSNMNNQVGYAPAGKFGSRAMLGTDGIGADMFLEAQTAYFRAREAGQPIDVLKYLANAQRLASECFGESIGPLRAGSCADLVILDYKTPTPVSAENVAGHLLFGLSSRNVEAVMVDGVWRMWARRALSADADVVAEQARATAQAVWARMAELP